MKKDNLILWISLTVIVGLILVVSKCNKPEIRDNYTALHKSNDSLVKLSAKQLQTIDSLKKIRQVLSDELLTVKLQQSKLQISYTQIKEVIQQLPLDSGIILLQSKLYDTTKIRAIKYNKKDRVLITPSDVTEINLSYATIDYQDDLINSLHNEVSLLRKSNFICTEIITRYDSILFNKATIIENKDKEIQQCQKENNQLKKSLKKRTLVFSVGAAILAIIAIGK